jgi:hypothetical protein
MDTILSVNLEGTWKQVDLYDDLPINVIIQETDLIVLDQRRSPYSKQFVVPGTKQNNVIFENYYEVNGLDFNPLSKVDCVVSYRGVDIFRGFLRLNAVNVFDTYVEYELFIMGNVGDFGSEIKEFLLRDCNWTDLNHDLVYSAVTLSWEAKDNDTDGLFGGKVIYPLINWGLNYPDGSSIPQFSFDTVSGTSFTLSGNPVPPSYFKPALRLKTIVDKVMDLTTYTYTSEFLTSDYFKSIYMDTFVNGELGLGSASALTNQNLFKVFTRPSFAKQYLSPDANISVPLNFETLGNSGFDFLSNFTLGSPPAGYNTQPVTSGSYFRIPFKGDYAWNIRFNYRNTGPVSTNINFYILATKGTDPNNLNIGSFYLSPLQSTGPGGSASVPFNEFFSGTCQAGEYVQLYYLPIVSSSELGRVEFTGFDFAGVFEEAPMWELYESPAVDAAQSVNFQNGIPDIGALDFLRTLVKMFNLVIVEDVENKTLIIEPWNWYYNEADRTERDFTQRLDVSQQHRIEPLSFDLPKDLQFTYKKGSEEYLNKRYEDSNTRNFGRFLFTSTNNLFVGEQTYELPFAALPTENIEGAPNIIIPKVYRDLNGIQQPYTSNNHIFFWCGNRYMYSNAAKTQESQWYLQSGGTVVEWTTYPAVSHLSNIDTVLSSIVSDLNFTPTFDYYGIENPNIVQATGFNLYDIFWKDYTENNYSNETRRLTGRFFFRPTDVYDISLRDKIYVRDSFYRIEKISEADLLNEKLTEISLIKERSGYYKVEPPSPIYGLSGNTAYPSLVAFNSSAYFSFSQEDVCNSTAPVVIITTFGSPVITNGTKIYYDTGSQMKLVELGKFIKQTVPLGSQTYVVADNAGRVLQVDC